MIEYQKLLSEPRISISVEINYPNIKIPILSTTRLNIATIVPFLNILDENGNFMLIGNDSIKDVYEINTENNEELMKMYRNGFLIKRFYNVNDLFSFFSKKTEVSEVERIKVLHKILNIKVNRPLVGLWHLLKKTSVTVIFLAIDLETDASGRLKYRNYGISGVENRSPSSFIMEMAQNLDLGEDIDLYFELGLRSNVYKPIHNDAQGSRSEIYIEENLVKDSKEISEDILASFMTSTYDIVYFLDGFITNNYSQDIGYHSNFITSNSINEQIIGERIVTLHGWYKSAVLPKDYSIMPASYVAALLIVEAYNNKKPFVGIVNRKNIDLFAGALLRNPKSEDVWKNLFDNDNNESYQKTRINSLYRTKSNFIVFLTDFTRKPGNNVLKQENAVRAAYKTKKWLRSFFKKLIGLRRRDLNYEDIAAEVKTKIATVYKNSNIQYDIVIDPEKNIFDNVLYVDFILKVGINVHKIKLDFVYELED